MKLTESWHMSALPATAVVQSKMQWSNLWISTVFGRPPFLSFSSTGHQLLGSGQGSQGGPDSPFFVCFTLRLQLRHICRAYVATTMMGLNLCALIFHRNNKKEGRRSVYRQTCFWVSESLCRVSELNGTYASRAVPGVPSSNFPEPTLGYIDQLNDKLI